MACFDCVKCLVLTVWDVLFWLCGMSCFDCTVCNVLTVWLSCFDCVVCLVLTVWYVLFWLCGMSCSGCVVCLVLTVWYVLFWLCGMSCFECVVCLVLTVCMSCFDCVVCLVLTVCYVLFFILYFVNKKSWKNWTLDNYSKNYMSISNLNVNVYVNAIYESSDVTSETNDVTPEKNNVIVLLTTIYFVRVINTVKVTITCVKLGYIFTVVTLIHVK